MNTQKNTLAIVALDLTKQAPRSPRVRLGGYAVLPRLLDKARADISGTIGEYHTNCMLDQEFLSFAGIDYQSLRAQLELGKGDGEIFEWIEENATHSRTPWEIDQWNEHQNRRSPKPFTELEDYFRGVLETRNKSRGDVVSWPDLLDLDDFCSFGGVA